MTEFATTQALRADDHPVSFADTPPREGNTTPSLRDTPPQEGSFRATPPREGNTTPAAARPRYRLVRFWPPRQPARRGFEPVPKRAMDIEASLK